MSQYEMSVALKSLTMPEIISSLPSMESWSPTFRECFVAKVSLIKMLSLASSDEGEPDTKP